MPIERPPLLLLDGLDEEAAYLEARRRFAEILLTKPVVDPLGRRVLIKYGYRDGPDQADFCYPADPPQFDAKGRVDDDCFHVCFKESGRKTKYNRLPRDTFKIERAKHIPFILTALTHPETWVHKFLSDRNEVKYCYSFYMQGDRKLKIPEVFFNAFTLQLPDPSTVQFLSAYPLGDQSELNDVRKHKTKIHPPKKVPASKSTD